MCFVVLVTRMTHNEPVQGYKVFNKDWICRNFQFAVGETFTTTKPIQLCYEGFHFCQHPVECNEYYELAPENKYAFVEAVGEVIIGADKCVTSSIKIVKEISYDEWLKLCTCKYTTYYDNAKKYKRYKCTYVNGLLDGLYESWCIDGFIYETSTYVNDKLHGEQTQWGGWDRHRVILRCNYVDGLKSGIEEIWYAPINQLRSRCNYVNGKLHGLQEIWTEIGRLLTTINYINGQKHGLEMDYAMFGLVTKIEWENDQIKLEETWYLDGELRATSLIPKIVKHP